MELPHFSMSSREGHRLIQFSPRLPSDFVSILSRLSWGETSSWVLMSLRLSFLTSLLLAFLSAVGINATRGDNVSATPQEADVIVYGGTSAAVTAAVQVRKMGKSVILVSPDKHLGGLSSSGLGFTDLGNPKILGGLSREFYHRVWQAYQDPAAWKPGGRIDPKKGQNGAAIDNVNQLMVDFEPHVAEAIFDAWVKENQIPVIHARLDLKSGVVKEGGRITAIKTEDGKVFHGKVFIDATYEGDLMAKAGVSYTVGREAASQYGENLNGLQVARATKNQLPPGIDPYVRPGDPSSGLLPGVNPMPTDPDGTGDKKIQAYCYRLCLTDVPENRVTIAKPEGYRETDYEILFRAIAVKPKGSFCKFSRIPNGKTDSNNEGGISLDWIGGNYAYPDADYAEREKIAKAHEDWQRGLLWTLQNSARVPEEMRAAYAKWGLAADEFTDNGNWPYTLYIREARRMVGEVVATQSMLQKAEPVSRSIGLGAYTLDSHNVQRIVSAQGMVRNEGDVQVGCKTYQLDYGVILPKHAECGNLLVPVCVSASHIAYGSIRMEPVFMILGQSAGAAACAAIDAKSAVQDVPYEGLQKALLAAGQKISL